MGIVAEPRLVPPGAAGVLGPAGDAGLVVLGLSERWRAEGIGDARLEIARASPVPTLLTRKGIRPGGLAPPEAPPASRGRWPAAERASPGVAYGGGGDCSVRSLKEASSLSH